MLQLVDSHTSERREWMGLLARAPLALLEDWAARLSASSDATSHEWLRRPEAGLVMVRARAGGTGERFNLGEMTVTRCALRVGGGATGIAYVQGRSARKAELAALADAMLQSPLLREAVRRDLLEPLRRLMEKEAASVARKAQATRVEFFTLARGEG
jgi:alpha-D-ribose 1-methylphosphonate 5-triphosphate synthase subunit PhnG